MFIQQTENNFGAFKAAHGDDAIHADLHLLASLHHLVQTQATYTPGQLGQPKQPLRAFNQHISKMIHTPCNC